MRLISVRDYSLREFSGRDIPPYAILSHTWGEGEVSYQDMQNLPSARELKGFRKIERCCKQAQVDGWAWAWVDTCCIDKTSSVELSEAVNSMFQWYARSMVCYVYLSDWFGGGLRACRYFSRGWTLQELIAPLNVTFYNRQWERKGTKKELKALLSDITGVPAGVLDQSEHLSEQTIGSRMSWASKRKTTREEDIAYCLLGIFDVNMPLLYGEGGTRAFLRLQEEIVKKWDDHTLFSWDYVSNLNKVYENVLQYSVDREESSFYGANSSSIEDFNYPGHSEVAYVTNTATSRGLATFLAGNSIKCPRDWTPRGIMADHPSKFGTPYGSTPLGQLLQDDPPQVTSRGLRLSLYLKEAREYQKTALSDYLQIARSLRGPWGSQEFLNEAHTYQLMPGSFPNEYPSSGPHWTSLPMYLAALDCTGPEEEDKHATAGSTKNDRRCAVILLLKLPGSSVRSEFMLAPYFCRSASIKEVKREWDLRKCYIQLQPPDDSNMMLRPAMCEVRCTQRNFGYRLKAQSWTGGFFSAFALENRAAPKGENLIYISCGMRPGYAFLDARLALADDHVHVAEQDGSLERDEGAAPTDKGKAVDFAGWTVEQIDELEQRRVFHEESSVQEICTYWRDQGILGHLAWTRVLGVKLEHPGPVLQMSVQMGGEGKKLSLTLHFDRTFSDGETTVSGLEVDQYTLWVAWQRSVH